MSDPAKAIVAPSAGTNGSIPCAISATTVSPSRATTSVRSLNGSHSRRLSDWVDLPAPSPPSKQTNTPVSAYTPGVGSVGLTRRT